MFQRGPHGGDRGGLRPKDGDVRRPAGHVLGQPRVRTYHQTKKTGPSLSNIIIYTITGNFKLPKLN